MKKQYTIIMIVFFSFFISSCKEKYQPIPLYFVQYTDSTYTEILKDTIEKDSIDSSFTGYFKIFKWRGTEPSYE